MENKSRFVSLTRRSDFLSLRSEGKSLHINAWLLVNFRATNSNVVRCGWTLSRQVGTAVVRNRLRRWGREYVRAWSRTVSGGVDMNLVFKRQDRGFYAELSHKEMDVVLAKMVEKLERRLE